MIGSLRFASLACVPAIARQLPSIRPQFSRVQQHCHRPSVRAMASDEASAAKKAADSGCVIIAVMQRMCTSISAHGGVVQCSMMSMIIVPVQG